MSKSQGLIFKATAGWILLPIFVLLLISAFMLYTLVLLVKAPFKAAEYLMDEIDKIIEDEKENEE